MTKGSAGPEASALHKSVKSESLVEQLYKAAAAVLSVRNSSDAEALFDQIGLLSSQEEAMSAEERRVQKVLVLQYQMTSVSAGCSAAKKDSLPR